MYVPGVTPVPPAAAGAGLGIGAAVTAESMPSMVKKCMYMDMVSVLVVNLMISIMLAEDCLFLVCNQTVSRRQQARATKNVELRCWILCLVREQKLLLYRYVQCP